MDKIDEILRDIDKCETPFGEPTIMSPYDSYYVFKNNPELCSLFGKNTLEDIDNYVKKTFLKEYWPKHLREH